MVVNFHFQKKTYIYVPVLYIQFNWGRTPLRQSKREGLSRKNAKLRVGIWRVEIDQLLFRFVFLSIIVLEIVQETCTVTQHCFPRAPLFINDNQQGRNKSLLCKSKKRIRDHACAETEECTTREITKMYMCNTVLYSLIVLTVSLFKCNNTTKGQ